MPRTTEELLKVVGRRIQEVRRSKGLTQEALAERLGMLPSNYARIEQGRSNVTLDTVHRIGKALKVDIVLLFLPPGIEPAKPGRPKKSS